VRGAIAAQSAQEAFKLQQQMAAQGYEPERGPPLPGDDAGLVRELSALSGAIRYARSLQVRPLFRAVSGRAVAAGSLEVRWVMPKPIHVRTVKGTAVLSTSFSGVDWLRTLFNMRSDHQHLVHRTLCHRELWEFVWAGSRTGSKGSLA